MGTDPEFPLLSGKWQQSQDSEQKAARPAAEVSDSEG